MEQEITNLPMVSIIIPVYNMESFLAETIESALQTDYASFEIVIMDDCSTDGSLALAQSYADKYSCVRVFTQSNQGVAAARNGAIRYAIGKYILPLDADDLISSTLVSQAVSALEADSQLKVVIPSAEFFGERTGKWNLKPFSRALLARKNMIPASAMYAKADWDRVGGYCETIIAREDWEFWISILKNEGNVLQLSEVGLYYRIRPQSKRKQDRSLKKHVIDVLNKRHPEFFLRELNGPLQYARSWSKVINGLKSFTSSYKMQVNPQYAACATFIHDLPQSFEKSGETIYDGRNVLKKYTIEGHELIVKSYKKPIWINQFIYGLFRASKAERSFHYANLFLKAGVGTPIPVGFIDQKKHFLLKKCYYVSLKSICNYQYTDFKKQTFVHEKEILQAIGRTTAMMHENGFLHKDYSAGNILFKDELPVPVEVIDLNRMRFHPIDIIEGCKNFERLPGNKQMYSSMMQAYAEKRGFDVNECMNITAKYYE